MSKTLMQKESSTAAPAPENWLSPAVDIHETKDGYTLVAEMPGVARSGLEITVDNNQLAIVGRRSLAEIPGEELHRETRAAHFRRVFELDPAVDTGRIAARIDQGLLTLSLPKAERVKPRQIAIEG